MNVKKRFAALFLILCMVLSLLSGCASKGGSKEDKQEQGSQPVVPNTQETTPSAVQEPVPEEKTEAESFTLMVYITGADLESDYGCATADINEMIYSDAGENLKIVIQTGGASKWQNSIISNKTVQRYLVNGKGLTLLDEVGNVPMTDSAQVADFIQFAAEQYPSDRYGFIFWDHGGGTIGGYGSDENFNDQGMNIGQIANALKDGGVHFDFIGFDCCLMATVETANAVSPYADYMIASEESEPGTGWYYTDFLDYIENDPNADMDDIAACILDSYMDRNNTDIRGGVTLSYIDLSMVGNIITQLYAYMANSQKYLEDNGYRELALARKNATSYGDDSFEQIDMIDYLMRTDVAGADALEAAIKAAVIQSESNIEGSNGLAMYYPYSLIQYYEEFSDITEDAGLDDDSYTGYFDEFVSVMSSGTMNGGGSNPYSTEQDTDYSYITDSDWYDSSASEDYDYTYVSDELEIYEKNGTYVLSMDEESWNIVTDINMQVYVDDGEGYLCLGSDDFYDFDSDGDLIVEYDYLWLYVDDCIVPYYAVESKSYTDGSYFSLGYIPGCLNGNEDISIWVYWDEDGPTILGYTKDYGEVSSKGYYEFKDGDVIDFWFDYYTYDGDYEDAYTLEDNSIVYTKGHTFDIGYGDIGDVETQVCFMLTDIYNNYYWTEPLYYTLD